MASASLPPIATLANLSADGRASVLDLLFEPCIQLHTLSVSSLAETSFTDYASLIENVRKQLQQLHESDLASDQKWLEAILSAHPRLGEKKVDSEMSKKEQAGLQGQGAEADEEVEKLRRLNSLYEAQFPGLIYVTFVNNRPRAAIMDDIQSRIASSTIDDEKRDAIQAMCDIALSRAHKLGVQ